MKDFKDSAALIHWFSLNKRSFPWRETTDPYAIWISEVMLQQTQAAVVIPYFERWMNRYPTVFHLAQAPLEEVIKAWEGLGYYSRARNLHAGAQYIVNRHNGIIPDNEAQLKEIKGLGPYTIGAILSFAFHKKKAAVDGNVLRVLARYYQIPDDITKASTQKNFRELVENILPKEDSWVFNEALIELGATICQRKAKCEKCPLSVHCSSFRHHTADKFPAKAHGPKTTHLKRIVAVIEHQGEYLLKKGPEGQIMSDLYEFFYLDCQDEQFTIDHLMYKLSLENQVTTELIGKFPAVKHSFTRFQVVLEPFHLMPNRKFEIEGYQWHSRINIHKLAFSSGHRKILHYL